MDLDLPLNAILSKYKDKLVLKEKRQLGTKQSDILSLNTLQEEYLKLISVQPDITDDFCILLLNIDKSKLKDIKDFLKKNKIIQTKRLFKELSESNLISYNPYPISKNANVLQMFNALMKNSSKKIKNNDSKLWYLNSIGADSYLQLQNEQDYFATTKQSYNQINKDISTFINKNFPNKNINVIDIGSGNGLVGLAICNAIGADKINAYYSVDISEQEQKVMFENHSHQPYKTICVNTCFDMLDNFFPLKTSDFIDVYIFCGGTYGNFKYKKINKDLMKALNSKNQLLIIETHHYDTKKQKQEIIDSYNNETVERFALGPLLSLGCSKEDFKVFPESNLRVSSIIKGDRNIIRSELVKDIKIKDKVFKKGCKISGCYSRKIDDKIFRANLSSDFEVLDLVKSGNLQTAFLQIKS